MCAKLLADWTDFYQRFGITLDPSGLTIPSYKDGFDRVLVIAKGLNHLVADELCRSLFEVHYHHSAECLNGPRLAHDRWPRQTYAIRIRESENPIDPVPNLLLETVKQYGIRSMTALERMILEAKYFTETGKHLDQRTLCAGTRFKPSAGSDANATLGVGWYDSTKYFAGDVRQELIISFEGGNAQRDTKVTRLVLEVD